MKKYFNFMAFALMAVFCLTFVSCGSDGDEPGPSSSLSEYVGTWSTITGIADGEFEYIQFKSDGNCTRVLYDEDAEKGYDVFSGTWAVNGDKLTIKETSVIGSQMAQILIKTAAENGGVTLAYDIVKKEKDKITVSLGGITGTIAKVNDDVIQKYLDGENIRTDEDASFSFTINGKNYYYGETYTYPGIGLKGSHTTGRFFPDDGDSRFSLALDAQDLPYKTFDSDGNPIFFPEYNSEVECWFSFTDFDPSTAKEGDILKFKQVVKEVYNGVVYDIYNKIEYREKAYSIEKSITFSWKDNNPKGQVKFVSYEKLENGSYLLTLDFQNVTLDRITDNTPFSNKSDQLVLNGKIIFTDNSTGQID